ncbi:MAG: dehydrogenase [Clostridiaceae bacterium]|nr:dehydrogenase [Clostridiaceae bacterium]
MTKKLFIDPSEVRKPGVLSFADIPVNQYKRTLREETGRFTRDDFLRIYHDMQTLRTFESMLLAVKTTGGFDGTPYDYPGPAHLSIGQEAAAVGQAYLLDASDVIFGSPRSHGEILAKGLSAIRKMPEADLKAVMENALDGDILRAVLPAGTPFPEDIRGLAETFLLYGALAEIFAKRTGFNRGLGGSMHAFFLPFGIFPNNAIVGGSGDVSVGAALYKKINRKPGVVVCNIGDGALGCGPVWEGFQLALMDQFNTLWEGEMKGGLPLLFNIMDNQYAMGGQTAGETMGYGMPARIGAGLHPDQMHAERIDGYNPLAVIDAMERKLELLRTGRGPVLLDTLTYRYAGHSPSDADSYRTTEEKDAWRGEDSIDAFRRSVIEAGMAEPEAFDAIDATVARRLSKVYALAIDPALSPRMDLSADPDAIGNLMFSNRRQPALDDRSCETLLPREDNPRVRQIARKNRSAWDENGAPVSKNKVFQLRDALFEAVLDQFHTDPTLVAYGEENRDWGGAFAVYRGLTESLPYHRLFNTPISEGAIVGSAVGYAMSGGRALVELMYCDFLGRAGDEVFNQLPKWQAMSAGQLRMPVVLRVSVGSKYGAQHSQDWTSLCTHIPGLKVVFPATPYDAKGLMAAALNGTDPVVFFESQRLYDIGERFHEGGVPVESYEIPIGRPDVKRPGKDLTILTVGATLYRALEAADRFSSEYGLEAEVVDARSLVPFDYEPVVESVRKTGRLIVAGDACERGSYLNDFARTLSELCFDDLDAPVAVLGSRNWITPAYELEEAFFPQPSWFLDLFHQRMMPLPGYQPVQRFNSVETVRRGKCGV